MSTKSKPNINSKSILNKKEMEAIKDLIATSMASFTHQLNATQEDEKISSMGNKISDDVKEKIEELQQLQLLK